MHNDVFPAIGALLGSDTVGQMLIPTLVPADPPVRFLVQRFLHVVFPGPAFSFWSVDERCPHTPYHQCTGRVG